MEMPALAFLYCSFHPVIDLGIFRGFKKFRSRLGKEILMSSESARKEVQLVSDKNGILCHVITSHLTVLKWYNA